MCSSRRVLVWACVGILVCATSAHGRRLLGGGIANEQQALLAIKAALDVKSQLSTWTSDRPACTYEGVRCNSAGAAAGLWGLRHDAHVLPCQLG